MHCADCQPTNHTDIGTIPITTSTPFHELQINLSALASPPKEQSLLKLIEQHVTERRLFYGLEIMAHSYRRQDTLYFHTFNSWLPLFISLVWLGKDYSKIENIAEVDSLRMARHLEKQMVVMPHFTCYNVTRKRVTDLLQLGFSNLLVLRGDELVDKQDFTYASELVSEIRNQGGHSISIGVGGYPEGHPDSKSSKEDLHFLKQKVRSGGDFIITQICFSAAALIDFVRHCREHGITVPILIGVYLPHNFQSLQRVLQLVRVQMPQDDFQDYKRLEHHAEEFRAYAIKRTVDLLETVLGNEDVDVFGLQFFTTNRFHSCHLVLKELHKLQSLQNKYNFNEK